ncbi:MAG: DUF1178 family protein [Novosphingobium sp.]
MIVFDLECREHGHRFEGWFGSSGDFAAQQERGLVACPQCGSPDVMKAPMAPNLGRKGNQVEPARPVAAEAKAGQSVPAVAQLPPQAAAMLRAMAAMQAEALKESRWVGDGFAEVSRAIHYGERDAETIHGQATAEEVEELFEEGIEVMPLPFPVGPPGEAN